MMNKNIHNVKASTLYKREHKSDYGKEKIEILYEDKDIIVIEKASGLLSVPYPGSKSRTALEILEKIMRRQGSYSKTHKPLIVHRLDRDTSGVMMFALNENTQKKIMNNWHSMVTERLYHAVAENPKNPSKILEKEGVINLPLAQNAYHVGYVKNKSDDEAKTVNARTHYKILIQGPTHTLFELSLDTGKKNQIRAHLSSLGYPLAGDENYRAKTDPFHRLALHARTLEFIHPTTNQKMRFEIPEDDCWKKYVEKGDFNPKTPIWLDKKAIHKLQENSLKIEKTQIYLPKKQSIHLDFISRGKLEKKDK